MRLILPAVGVCLLLFLHGCDVFDKEEDIPGFVFVASAELETDPLVEGENTHAITDVHVFYDGDFAGAYELPAHIPIYGPGERRLVIAPGIKNNGMGSNRVIYPFYDNTDIDVEIIPEVSVPITPDSVVVFKYFKGTSEGSPMHFLIDAFELPGNVWIPQSDDSVGVINTTQPEYVRSGSGGGLVELNESRKKLLVYSSTDTWPLEDMPRGVPVYLEIDFKGDVAMEIGLRVIGQINRSVFVVGLNPTQDWTKVYVDLTDEINAPRDATNFQILLKAEKPDGMSEAVIAMDNIKLIYPK